MGGGPEQLAVFPASSAPSSPSGTRNAIRMEETAGSSACTDERADVHTKAFASEFGTLAPLLAHRLPSWSRSCPLDMHWDVGKKFHVAPQLRSGAPGLPAAMVGKRRLLAERETQPFFGGSVLCPCAIV